MKQILRINTDRKSVKYVAKIICENQYNPCNPWRKKSVKIRGICVICGEKKL